MREQLRAAREGLLKKYDDEAQQYKIKQAEV